MSTVSYLPQRDRGKKEVCLGYQDAFFMPIKAPRDANPRKTIREIRKNSYTERGRPVEIHRFLTRANKLAK